LAHINYKALPYICKVVTGLPELKVVQEGICNGCAQGKNIKNPFPKRENKAEGALELIHSDKCGPMPSSSISRSVYYVSFIDYYSRKTWIYFLKSKDEVFNKFKEFKALIENLSKRKIKILRSDNGGEYTSKEFVSFCRDVRIKREITTPYNPQQNNVVERKNRTIMEAMKTMIHEEMFIGKKLEVIHLKIFGCLGFIHIPKEKINKLEPSEKKGIFVGYCEVSKAFRIYIPIHCHIEISRNMTFDKEAALKKSRRCHLEEVYEEEPENPRTTKSVREVPRVAEPVREVIASPDDETPEDHDITKVQEPPQRTFSHKRKPTWERELIQDGEKYGVPEGTTS
jgi:transposase InsO family protein